jgi:hypothetical protein
MLYSYIVQTTQAAMAFLPIRELTTADRQRIEASAQKFLMRHSLTRHKEDFSTALQAVEYALILDTEGTRRSDQGNLGRNWRRCLARAAKVEPSRSLTIAYGMIGYSRN